MEQFVRDLKKELSEMRAELEEWRSGRTTWRRRPTGTLERIDMVPREIALLEGNIVIYEAIIEQHEGAPCAG